MLLLRPQTLPLHPTHHKFGVTIVSRGVIELGWRLSVTAMGWDQDSHMDFRLYRAELASAVGSFLIDTYCKTAVNSTIKPIFQIVNKSCSCGATIPQ